MCVCVCVCVCIKNYSIVRQVSYHFLLGAVFKDSRDLYSNYKHEMKKFTIKSIRIFLDVKLCVLFTN